MSEQLQPRRETKIGLCTKNMLEYEKSYGSEAN